MSNDKERSEETCPITEGAKPALGGENGSKTKARENEIFDWVCVTTTTSRQPKKFGFDCKGTDKFGHLQVINTF